MSLTSGLVSNLSDDSTGLGGAASSSPTAQHAGMNATPTGQHSTLTNPAPAHSLTHSHATGSDGASGNVTYVPMSSTTVSPGLMHPNAALGMQAGMPFVNGMGTMLPLPMHSTTIRGTKSTVSPLTSAPDYPIAANSGLSSTLSTFSSSSSSSALPLTSSSPSPGLVSPLSAKSITSTIGVSASNNLPGVASSTLAAVPGSAPPSGGKKKAEKRKNMENSTLIRRMKHKEVEIRRRAKLAKLFTELQEVLNTGPMDKASILQHAIHFVRQTKGMPAAATMLQPGNGRVPPYAAMPPVTSMDAMQQVHSAADPLALPYALTPGNIVPTSATNMVQNLATTITATAVNPASASMMTHSSTLSGAVPSSSSNSTDDDESMNFTDDAEDDDDLPGMDDGDDGMADVTVEGDDDHDEQQDNGSARKRKKRTSSAKEKRTQRGKSGDKAKEENSQDTKVEPKEGGGRGRSSRAAVAAAAAAAVAAAAASDLLPK